MSPETVVGPGVGDPGAGQHREAVGLREGTTVAAASAAVATTRPTAHAARTHLDTVGSASSTILSQGVFRQPWESGPALWSTLASRGTGHERPLMGRRMSAEVRARSARAGSLASTTRDSDPPKGAFRVRGISPVPPPPPPPPPPPAPGRTVAPRARHPCHHQLRLESRGTAVTVVCNRDQSFDKGHARLHHVRREPAWSTRDLPPASTCHRLNQLAWTRSVSSPLSTRAGAERSQRSPRRRSHLSRRRRRRHPDPRGDAHPRAVHRRGSSRVRLLSEPLEAVKPFRLSAHREPQRAAGNDDSSSRVAGELPDRLLTVARHAFRGHVRGHHRLVSIT